MSNGPSKEDLELYWNNSRQYFDELAKHYQQADPEYYRKFIKPYYDNPFRSSGSQYQGTRRSGGGAKIMVLAVFMFLVIGGAGAALFFITSGSEHVEKKIDEKINEMVSSPDKDKKSIETVEEPVKEEDPEGLSDEDKYILGAKLIAEKKYDKAVFYLKQIPPGSKRYKEAQQLIESVKYLKKYGK